MILRKTIKLRKTTNKRAVSLMVSYVLLIVISLGLAGGVYSFLKFRATIPTDEGCPVDAVLTIKSYNCNNQTKILTLEIENRGLFNISGFFIRATNNTEIPAIMPLQTSELEGELGKNITGRYYFNSPLAPNSKQETKFSYTNAIPIKKIEIQPFIVKERLQACDNIISLQIDTSRNCN